MSSADFDRLQKDIYRRDWKTPYLLYESGVPEFYHLGEKGKPELHLQAARAYQVMDFVGERAPKMFRFAEQTDNWQWMHYLDSEWFHHADSTDKINAERDSWAYWEVFTSTFKSHFNHNNLPYYPGIYVVTNACYARLYPEILYVGKAQNSISDRWRNHHKAQKIAERAPLVRIHCFNAECLIFDDLREAEKLFSRQLRPSLNKRIG